MRKLDKIIIGALVVIGVMFYIILDKIEMNRYQIKEAQRTLDYHGRTIFK